MKYKGRRITRATIGLLLDLGIIAGSVIGIVSQNDCPDKLGAGFIIFILSLCVNVPRFAMEVTILCKKLGRCRVDHPRALCICYIIFTICKFILSVLNMVEVILAWDEPACVLMYRASILSVDIMQMVSCGFDIWFLWDSRDQLRKDTPIEPADDALSENGKI